VDASEIRFGELIMGANRARIGGPLRLLKLDFGAPVKVNFIVRHNPGRWPEL
jgi:hypothetical protein